MIKNKKVSIGTSAGINSAAILINVIDRIKQGEIPSELHLIYVHINQHSPDSEPFVDALVAYAKHHFPKTINPKYYRYDVLDFFKEQRMIPHPKADVCSRKIKTENLTKYKSEHGIEVDLIGYVNTEKFRINNLVNNICKRQSVAPILNSKGETDVNYYIENGLESGMFEKIYFPIAGISNEDCFTKVKNAIGWYPSIYDIFWTDERIIPFLESVKGVMPEKDRQIALRWCAKGSGMDGSIRVFNHNNCLPCKNMQVWQFWLVKLFFPEFFEAAVKASKEIGAYYGRSEADYEAIKIYTSFGREDFEVDFKEQSCGSCVIG